MKEKIRIGAGAGFSGDRIDAAITLVEQGELDYLVLECLAERTIAIANKNKLADPSTGYDPLLERRIENLLPLLVLKQTKLITNMGAANPLAAGKKIIEIATKLNLPVKVAVIIGDDILHQLKGSEIVLETGLPISESGKLVSANAYLGAEALMKGLQSGANIIITGRVADPSLFVAAFQFELGWDKEDYVMMGQATVIGHLLECAGQLTGGYFADGVKKMVPGLDHLGHPFADVYANGTAIFGKVSGTGGLLNAATVKEQLLYEVMDPAQYITPDVVADFTSVNIEEVGLNRVKVWGGKGTERTEKLKVSVGYDAGYLGEGEISYAGAFALNRAELAAAIIQERLKNQFTKLQIDFIGISSMHGTNFETISVPYEIRLRIAAMTHHKDLAARIGEEVEALYTNGPAGGGAARKNTQQIIGIHSILMDRNEIIPQITLLES